MKKLDIRYWGPFWRNPTITSFGKLFPDNYDGAMLEFWRRQVTADVADIVDLACGNGALTWIAHDLAAARGAATRITGIDLAPIDPFRSLGRRPEDFPRVQFLGATSVEDLPLPDSSVDLVISQYGIEYADLDKVVAEVARVLRPAGRMAFILHDRESVIIGGATQHLDDFRRVRDDIRLHELCLRFDELLRSDRNLRRLSQTDAFRRLEADIAGALYHARRIASGHPPTSPVLPYLERLTQALQMRGAKQAAERRRLMEQAGTALHAHIERVEDLWLAALSEARRERLLGLVSQHGFRVTEHDIMRYRDGDNFGRALAACRV